MYKYKIGYYSQEGSSYVELEHEKLFTEDDITDMMADCIIEVLPLMKENGQFIHSFEDVFHGNFEDINVVKLLIENKGFKLINYDTEWAVDGWNRLFEKTRLDEHDPYVEKIKDKIKEKGFTKKEYDSMYEEEL